MKFKLLSKRICDSIEEVVVFPCVPAIAIQNLSLEISPNNSDLLIIVNPLFLKKTNCLLERGIAGV